MTNIFLILFFFCGKIFSVSFVEFTDKTDEIEIKRDFSCYFAVENNLASNLLIKKYDATDDFFIDKHEINHVIKSKDSLDLFVYFKKSMIIKREFPVITLSSEDGNEISCFFNHSLDGTSGCPRVLSKHYNIMGKPFYYNNEISWHGAVCVYVPIKKEAFPFW